MTKGVFIILLLIPAWALCQLPQSDIWLIGIKPQHGNVRFEEPRQITSQKGYENQPGYSADGKTIYYTVRNETEARSVIYAYTVSNKQSKQVTFTGMSPYSPTASPANNGISVLMVEEDSTQRIWQYPFSGSKPYVLFPKCDSIGYYAWINTNSVLAYILGGKSSPSRLSLVEADGREKKLAEGIGRGMKVIGKEALFIKKEDSINYVYWTDYSQIKKLVKTPGNSEYLAAYKDLVLMANNGTIYGAKMKREMGKIMELEEFAPLQDLSGNGLKKITRIAISPDEKTMAVAVDIQ